MNSGLASSHYLCNSKQSVGACGTSYQKPLTPPASSTCPPGVLTRAVTGHRLPYTSGLCFAPKAEQQAAQLRGGQDDPRVAGILQVNSIGPLLGHPPAASSYALSAILPARPGGTLSCLGQAGDAGDRILERLQREGPGSYRGTASASGAKAWTELEGTRAGTRAGAEVQLPRRTLEEVRTQDWEEGKTVTPLLALELGMLFRMPPTRAKQPGICLLALTGHRWPQDRVQSLKQRSTSKGDSQRVAAPPTRQAQAAQCHSHCPPPLVLSGPVCLAWKQPFLDSGELTRWW